MCDDNIKDIEIKESIMSLNTNKSPGTDGLTGEFYKTFIDNLLPILNIIYAENGVFPVLPIINFRKSL